MRHRVAVRERPAPPGRVSLQPGAPDVDQESVDQRGDDGLGSRLLLLDLGAEQVYRGVQPRSAPSGQVRPVGGERGQQRVRHEEVYTHARDPHTRIDVLATSRCARAELGGVVLADSATP
jgi:hypothetical protein